MHFTEMILGYEHEFKSVLAIQLYLVMAVRTCNFYFANDYDLEKHFSFGPDRYVQLNISCSEFCIMQLHNVKIHIFLLIHPRN